MQYILPSLADGTELLVFSCPMFISPKQKKQKNSGNRLKQDS